MDRIINLERGRGTLARLKFILTEAGVCVRTQEWGQSRWVYTSRAWPLPEIPDSDEWELRVGPILLRCRGTLVDVWVDGQELGRCSAMTLSMYVDALLAHVRRLQEPLPPPDRP
jgi:hypothetical protein